MAHHPILLLVIGIIIIIFLILNIASSAVAINCYNNCDKSGNKGFLIFNIIFGLLLMLGAFYIIKLSFSFAEDKNYKALTKKTMKIEQSPEST